MTIDHGVSIPFVPMSAATVRTVCVFSSLLFSRRFSFFPWGGGGGGGFSLIRCADGGEQGVCWSGRWERWERGSLTTDTVTQ